MFRGPESLPIEPSRQLAEGSGTGGIAPEHLRNRRPLRHVECRSRLETVAAGIADVNQRLERLYDALETGKVTMDDLSPRIQELRERQKQLNAAKWELEALLADRHLEMADEKTVRPLIEELRALLSESPLSERRSFIRSFVNEVKVTGDQVVLTYTLPMPPKELTVEAMPVPPIVQYGGRYRT
jgi:uncharacterized protein involved in exopolysaccharide biosynthesis